jgi:hypothetical protein
MQAIELIKESFSKTAIFDPKEEIEGEDIHTGLILLNEVITQWSSLQIYIPLTATITINLTEGISEYTVSPLIMSVLNGQVIDSGNALSVLTQANDDTENTFDYELTPGRPYYVYLIPKYDLIDLTTGEPSTILKFFPVPDADYTVNLQVKQIMGEVELYDNLTMPKYYFRALKYELGMELLNAYEEPISQSFQKKYDEIISQLKAANKKDMSVKNANPFLSSRWYRPRGFYVG